MRAAFSLIDRDADGFIRNCELRDFLADHGFYATERELAGLMVRMDMDKDNRISFVEFQEQFTPKLMKVNNFWDCSWQVGYIFEETRLDLPSLYKTYKHKGEDPFC